MLDDDTTTPATTGTGDTPEGSGAPASGPEPGAEQVQPPGDTPGAHTSDTGPGAGSDAGSGTDSAPAAAAPAKRAARKTTSRKTAASRAAAAKAAGEASGEGPTAAPDDTSRVPAPGAPVPGSSTPGSSTPDSSGPDSSGPDSSGPDISGPDISGPAAAAPAEAPEEASAAPAKKATKKATKRTAAKKTAAKKAPAKRAASKKAAAAAPGDQTPTVEIAGPGDGQASAADSASTQEATGSAPTSLLFQAPDPTAAPTRRRRKAAAPAPRADATTEDTLVTDQAAAEAAVVDDTATVGSDEPAAHVDEAEVDSPAGDTELTSATDDGATDGDSADATDSPDGDDDEAQDAEGGDEQGGGGNRRRRRRGGRRRRRGGGGGGGADEDGDTGSSEDSASDVSDGQEPAADGAAGGGQSRQRGQRGQGQGGQNVKKQGGSSSKDPDGAGKEQDADSEDDTEGGQGEGSSRRRRRRRRTGEEGDGGDNGDGAGTVVRVRKPRNAEDEITSLHGSTRLEAKKQRRREGREAGRRRAPIVSEAEFLARRESVDRVMVMRQNKDLTQIAVLEDKVLVEHYVARESQTSLIGNVYLGRVQNVLPSMEAAFIDIGKGRNAVLYAGEVNWSALGAGNGPRKIEQVLKSGQQILVQVSKDPIGHKGARLTSQVSLPGRFLVYVPDGTTSGISRRLPDTERTRLKTLLKEIVPDTAGVIVRTAAEGASEEELRLDVERLTSRWADIEAKIEKANGGGAGPQLLYGEPDLTLKVVRDLFTEDFGKLVVSGDDAWDLVDGYVKQVAPDLEERLERYDGDQDVFAAYRVDEQIAKGLDRKVWLPSGGSLVIDRTEAMTVVDVNTGKFTGSGGNLEETVTKNNLEAAEEIVRQLRLRDIGGIIVVDFIDMVLESNRDLVLRRLVECLGRDRTRHQVAEVTSLGLVQMTRKRIGTGLLESFSENCEHCQGRGVVVHMDPVEPRKQPDEEPRRGGRRGRGRGEGGDSSPAPVAKAVPTPKDLAAMPRHEPKPPVDAPADEQVDGSAASVAVDGPGASEAVVAEPVAGVGLAGPQVTSLPEPQDDADGADAPAGEPDSPAPEPVTADPSSVEPAPGIAEPAVTEPTRATGPTEPADPDAVTAPREAPELTEATEPTDPAAAPEPAAPAVPTGPRLVTSTRRRVVRRPAGPPAGMVPTSSDSSSQGTATEPTTGPTTGPTTDSTAGDGRSRGPGGGHGGVEADASADLGDGSAGPDGDVAGTDPVHVPVKKRGRRR